MEKIWVYVYDEGLKILSEEVMFWIFKWKGVMVDNFVWIYSILFFLLNYYLI